MAGTARAGKGKSSAKPRPSTRRAPGDKDGGVPDGSAAALPVRDGEEIWTSRELTAIREQLEKEMAEFRDEIAAAESEIADRIGDVAEGAGDDQADLGAKTFEREHEMALTYNARDLLEQNERALERIGEGTYGICESCGRAIGKARLQAFPRATLCVTCKQRQERR